MRPAVIMTNHSLPAVVTESPKIAIIGGGLTGLFTATLLERAFAQNIAQDSANTLTANYCL